MLSNGATREQARRAAQVHKSKKAYNRKDKSWKNDET